MGEQYAITSTCSNVPYTVTDANSCAITDSIRYMMPQYYYPDSSYFTTLSGGIPSGTCNNLVEDSTILKINIKKKSIKLNFKL